MSDQTTIATATISVPARLINDHPRSTIRSTTSRGDGNLYGGSSMTNAGVGPRSIVRFSTNATTAAATTPTKYIANITNPWSGNNPPRYALAGINAPINSV